ncbi:MAG: ABC transporter substrate-binding protein [Bacteriovoracaceae bacterium]
MMTNLLLALILLLSFSCRKAGVDEGTNSIRVGLTSEISTIDPALSYDGVSAEIVYQLYETLYEYDYLKRPYSLKPLLAEDMPVVENGGTKYTIKLKKNVFYHSHPAFAGKKRTMKAQDFIDQFKRLAFIPTASTGWWLLDGKVKGINKFRELAGNNMEKLYSLNVEGLKAPDDYTLVIDLEKPYPQLLNGLALAFATPIPLEVIKYHQNILAEVDAGTGPFYLVEINLNQGAKLKKFNDFHPDYYPSKGDRVSNDLDLLKDANKKLPFLNEVHYSIMKEDQTRWLNFLSDKTDWIQLPKDNYTTAITPQGDLSEELKEKKIQYQVVPTLTYWWLSFNMRDPLLGKNRNLRAAIAHAINWDKYIQLFTNNVGQKSNSIYPPGIPGYNPSKVLPYDYNIEKAKEFLKQAGFPAGKGLQIFKFDIRGTSTLQRQQAEFIQKELDAIGIKLEIIINTFPSFLKKSRGGELQFWQGGWITDYPDAENILQLLISKNHSPGPNNSFYSNPKVDILFEKLKVMNDGAEKFEIMDEIEKQVTNDIPWVMQYYARNYMLYHSRLKNFRHSDIIFNYYKYLKVSDI